MRAQTRRSAPPVRPAHRPATGQSAGGGLGASVHRRLPPVFLSRPLRGHPLLGRGDKAKKADGPQAARSGCLLVQTQKKAVHDFEPLMWSGIQKDVNPLAQLLTGKHGLSPFQLWYRPVRSDYTKHLFLPQQGNSPNKNDRPGAPTPKRSCRKSPQANREDLPDYCISAGSPCQERRKNEMPQMRRRAAGWV